LGRAFHVDACYWKQVDGDAKLFVLATLPTALGFNGGSGQQPFGGLESMWFGLNRKGIAGMDLHGRVVTWLTDFDRRIIRFAYERVPLKADKKIIKQLVRKRWKEGRGKGRVRLFSSAGLS